MDNSTKVLYREIEERFVKVIWTHKIHLCQASIHVKNNKCHNTVLAILSVLVSAAAIINVLKWLPEGMVIPVLAVLSLALTFFTVLYKSENLGKAATDNEHFAATMHDLRNRYAGLLSDIKSGLLNNQQIVEQRRVLEHEENLIYSGIVPSTSARALKAAEKALKTNQDSTTTDEEISLLVSENLHIE
jgi:hypothetical protein